MNRLNTISQYIIRMALSLALLSCVALSATAQTDYSVESKWDGTAVSTFLRTKSLIDPSCIGDAGSETNPYLIESAANLKYLQQTPALWNAGLYFEQMVDIDLQSYVLGTIGYALCGDGTAWATAKNSPTYSEKTNTASKAFMGNYDGRGHVIKNLLVDWGKLSSGGNKTSAFGLFGFVGGGTIKNITIQDAVIKRGKDAESFKDSKDLMLRVGVLVGAVSHGDDGTTTKIENIIVNNSVIRDYDATPGDAVGADATNLFFGGVIGDVANGNSGTTAVENPVIINNCYANVDISLENTTRNPNKTDENLSPDPAVKANNRSWQFIVGGIVGRYRARYVDDLPTNTVYTGTINAPISVIGPCYGGSRGSNSVGGDKAQEVTRNYAGDFATGGTLNGTPHDKGRNFFDYKVNGETITDTYPSGKAGDYSTSTYNPTKGCKYGTRTLAPNDFPSNGFIEYLIPEYMKAFQGVNHGTYIEDSDAAKGELTALNSSSDYDWNLSSKTATFTEKTPATHSLAAEQTAWNKYTATLTGTDAGFHYRWFAVNEVGDRMVDLGISNSAVYDCDTPLPADTKELIVFLCNSDNDSYYLDNGHYVFGLCLAKYTSYIDFTLEGDGDGPFTIVTPKVYLHNVETNTDEEVSTDGWTFKVNVYNSANTLYKEVTDANYNDGKAFRMPPTINVNAKFSVVGTKGGIEFTTALKQIPETLYVQLSSSTWERQQSPEGFRFTLAMKMAPGTGEYVKFSEDWEMKRTWKLMKSNTNLDMSLDWNKFTTGVTEDGKLLVTKDDHALTERIFHLTLEDFYGFTVERKFDSANDKVSVVGSANRNIRDVAGEFQTYNFEYKWASDGILTPNTSRFYEYKYFFDTEPKVYTPLTEIATFKNDTFSIKRVHMAETVYHFRMEDKYGTVYDYSTTKTAKAPTAVDYKFVDGNLDPELIFDGVKRNFKQAEWGLTYNWTVQFYDADNDLMGDKTITHAGKDYLEPIPFFDADRAVITLKATDYLGNEKEFVNNLPLNLDIDVVQTGEGPYYTFTAGISTFSGFPWIFGGKWQWYGVNGDITDDTSNRYRLPGETANVLTLNATNSNYSGYCVVWTSDDGTVKREGYWAKADIIYVFNREQTVAFNADAEGFDEKQKLSLRKDRFKTMLEKKNADDSVYYPDGNDFNTGRTPMTAVRTMKRAYELLEASKAARENMIVVMGYLDDLNYLRVQNADGYNHDYDRNATITGNYGEVSDGILRMHSSGTYESSKVSDGLHVLGGATIFKDITLFGNKEINDKGNVDVNGTLYFYCQLHDLTFGNGVKIEAYKDFSANTSGIYDAPAPEITIVGGMHNYAGKLEYPQGNAVKGQATINIFSGCFGRIIASARNDHSGMPMKYNTTSHNVFGHPDHPHRVEVNVAIKHASSTRLDYTPEKKTAYKYDIGLLVGGQTDGAVYAESKQKLFSGKVGRFISGNISFGRKTYQNTDTEQFPSDGFFGSTTLTLEGGEIGELVGGTLGRHKDTWIPTDFCEAYFYGRSILNINGGTINNNIYGAGAGGVVGLHWTDEDGSPVVYKGEVPHTKDKMIPYYGEGTDYNGYRKISYGDYDAAKDNMPTMPLLNGKALDLGNSYCEVNINGGVVKGDVFGGGYGYSKEVDWTKALDQSGYLFGRSYVNVNGGTVKGNVYGGGAGATEYVTLQLSQKYYNARYAYYKSEAGGSKGDVAASNSATADRTAFINEHLFEWINGETTSEYVTADDLESAFGKFQDLACIFGDTHVNVSGGIIEGRIYAGTKGISGFPEMATLYGNTSLNIENKVQSDNTTRIPLINGNIYGGSELGRITGNTHVEVSGGAIGNCIFGGSEGIEEDYTEKGVSYKKTTAYIGGNVELYVNGGSYFTADDTIKIPKDNKLKLTAATRTFNIYGGGYRNCIIEGGTQVYINKSLFSSFRCLLEGRDFKDCAADETFRKFSVYGAGRGVLTDVYGNVSLNINLTGGASVPSTKPVDVANNQQFFMICGGGFAGNVYGDTEVYLNGNVFARAVYGGGMYGRIEGTSNLYVNGGSYYNIYGGGLLGDIMKGSNLSIGVQKDELGHVDPDVVASKNRNIYVYENVYGGNDVGGIVGYERALDHNDKLIEWTDKTDENPQPFPVRVLYKETPDGPLLEEDRNFTLHSSSDDYGVNMHIYGGTILGNVYGAGNGNHTGYYVPNKAHSERHKPNAITRMKYTEGPAYLYRFNTNDPAMAGKSLLNEDDKVGWGLYEYRPRVRRVRMHIGGNTSGDRVKIGGSVYGGGHACTIGKYDPEKDVLKDPSRFVGGGTLKMNFGSHVTVGGGVYMGSRGDIIGKQTVVSEVKEDYEGTLNSDYDYHYFDPDFVNEDGTTGRYLLGFPNTVDGRKRFHAYMKLIDMDAKTQLTFYDNPDSTEVNGDESLPDLKAYNPKTFDAKDLRWGSFFAGGARGSMTYEPYKDDAANEAKAACYEYTLPRGLTVEARVVGGSEDAQVVFYQYADDYKSFDETKPIFTYDGGIVYDHNDGETTFGGGVVIWDGFDSSEDPLKDATKDKVVGTEVPRKKRVVMRLNVNCDFDPQMSSYTDEFGTSHDVRYGGLVYGGCYNSGITNGSVEVTCTNNLLGGYYESDDYRDYLSWSTLRHNIGRVYGGGFGERASIWGETHVTLDKDFRGFNVFGGGMMGHVTYGTHVIVKGVSKVYNAVYGGGMRGHVGFDPLTNAETVDEITKKSLAQGTEIDLISGGVDRVYGGAFMGDVYGGTHILASDEGQAVGTPRLLVGTIYGGNDVTGTIDDDDMTGLCTDIRVAEEPRTDKKDYTLSHVSAADATKYYGGYPLIGTVYGAGNGNMGDYIEGVTIDQDLHEYSGGAIHIANGDHANIDIWDFAKLKAAGKSFKLPDVQKSRVTVEGGTIVNVYGGGSMCTVKGSDEIIINYTDTVARAAVPTAAANDEMTWGVLRLFQDLQRSEVTTEIGNDTRFSYQIYRVFGGNNLMDMAIQPTWQLTRGQIFSVYSGGNFGRMTYYNPSPDYTPVSYKERKYRGLSLSIDSKDIRIASVYGGGRVGDIHALAKRIEGGVTYHEEPTTPFEDTEYGATLNILDGIIGDVYGGNNVAGTVYNGTNVNIQGAISGNVYGSGNGNYIYYYDYDNSKSDPYNPGIITEGYNKDYGGRYFILPKKVAHIEGTDTTYYGTSDEEKILAINRYRPNVDKAYLNIQGTPTSQVYVLGNVYCGGNSSTVLYNPAKTDGDIKFRIGSYVTLGGVFLGSNGKGLADAYNITYLSNLNNISDLAAKNKIADRTGFDDESKIFYNDKLSCDTLLYPNLLSLYMRAAEVTALPTGFALPEDAVEAYIGDFCLGGNYGSMMTDKKIDLTLPENLTIFGRVVGGCYNSRVEFGEVSNRAVALGGMTKPLATGTEKVKLTIKSKFRPWFLVFDDDTHEVNLVNDRVDAAGNYVPDDEVVAGTAYSYRDGLCNIFGGCFTSGKTIGDISIDIYSDVLGFYENGGKWDKRIDGQKRNLIVDRDMMKNNVTMRRTAYSLAGAGYGSQTELEGNVHLRLLPRETSALTLPPHPSVLTIFAGSHDGKHIGNSTVEIRDGMVFSNLYGGSRAAYKYGSSEIIVGYPKYYKVKESGTFTLYRADQYSYVAQAINEEDSTLTISSERSYKAYNHDGTPVIKQTVKYKAGDIVAANVVGQMIGFKPEKTTLTTIEAAVTASEDELKAANASIISSYLDERHESPTDFDTEWNNIDINIGDNSQMNNPDAKFYGGGGIYGGGHALNSTGGSLSGINTQLAYDKDNNPENSETSESIGYGGNSTIMIGDDPDDAHDHIAIGTGHYIPVKLKKGEDRIGLYKQGTDGFVHMSSDILDDDDFNDDGTEKTTYYKMEAAGGVFGDGARTFVQNFRAVDITGYGYADTNPQSAKLINTFQRIDLLSLNDCCLQLQGTQDYATNSIDNTVYSIARVGEIRMNSSLNSVETIEQSVKDTENLGNMSLAIPKSRNYMGFFHNAHYIGALYSNTSFDSSYRSNTGKKESQTYREVKKGYITNYETNKNDKAFKPRNLGTSPNMVGINNGFTLKLQNVFTTPPEGSGSSESMLDMAQKDNIYYGPIVGVVEVKLLTVQADEGGGYIYALNHHEDKTGGTEKTFLEDTGNFVFASRIAGSESSDDENFIVDDCFPLGYYSNHDHATDEEVHYWFVEGHKYFYNTTLTGYTYNRPIDFYLNNTDALILLSGITADNASTIELESVDWRDHTGTYKSALRDNLDGSGDDSREKYQLYFSIDSKTEKEYTPDNPDNAYVARIPNGNSPDACGYKPDNTFDVKNNFGNDATNTPLVGIRLHDTDTLNNRPDFYKSHLSDEDYVVIKLKAVDGVDDKGNTIYNYYTINLTIDYLQGPYIDGKVTIENCALPGEYIYANTDGITIEMADELTVTGKRWYLYPKCKRADNTFYWDNSQKVEVTKFVQGDIGTGGNRLQLPARYYQDDWQLDFVVVVNGQPFGLNNSELEIPRITVHNYHRMSTVASAVKNFGGHNSKYGYDLDLDLVGGALVYIESNEDFEIFTKYVNYCNSYRTGITSSEKPDGFEYRLARENAAPSNPAEYTGEGAVLWQKDKKKNATDPDHWTRVMRAEVLPGFNRMGGITGFTDNNAILGYNDDEDVPLQNVKNPSGAENIRFVLTTDVETSEHCMPIGQFRGRLIGNGHVINFKSGYHNSNFIDKNYGDIFYLGFVSSGGKDDDKATACFYNNYGRVENCFYYNYLAPGAPGYDKYDASVPDVGRVNDALFIDENYGSLVQNIGTERSHGGERYWIGTVDNCYQNCDMKQANALHMDALRIQKDIEDKKIPAPRYPVHGILRYRSSQSFHNGMIAYNLNQEFLKARWKSHGDDALVCEQMDASYIDDDGNYVEGDFLYNYYADGDYRYAYIYDTKEHPEALRIAATENGWPNYEDRIGNGQTMHKRGEDAGRDNSRWFTTQRDDIVQMERGQIKYEEVEETVEGTLVKRIKPVLGNTGYFPLYRYQADDNSDAVRSDFIFFGERLTADTKFREYYPKHVNHDNRVYRASGAYGSRIDYGFHFNREAEALVPQLTAIDFTGTLDLKYKNGVADEDNDVMKNLTVKPSYENGTPQYKERWQFYVKNGGKIGQYGYESDKYYSYEKMAANYTKDEDDNWVYQENLQHEATDSLIQLIFYPPLLDLPGGDHPAMLHNVKSLKIDSNREIGEAQAIKDHSHVTKNLLVYTPEVGTEAEVNSAIGSSIITMKTTYKAADEERLFNQFHYSRMHTWGDVEGETDQNKIVGHHIRWVNHEEGEKDVDGNPLTPHFHVANGLFHLVDEQDFNAPIDFYVADDVQKSTTTNGRAWLKRAPKNYSSRVTIPDDNGFTVSKDAWESIALPFTCNRVVAVNSEDYVEKYSRGQITHFYGNDPDRGITHHDYWLRGLVETAKDTYPGDDVIAKADFARPGSESGLFRVQGDINGDGHVTDMQMTGNYAYKNDWFYDAYNEVGYSHIHDEYGSDVTEDESTNHLADTLLYKDYRYLTKNAPYIVAFPGKDYYEFDLSGEFYNERNSTIGCNPQEILYEFTVDEIDDGNNFDSSARNVRIPVTDAYDAVRTTFVTGKDGTKTKHHATFKRIVISDKVGVDEDLYVLNDGTEEDAYSNGCLTVNVKGSSVTLPPGSAFINCKDFGITEILPFRTYLEVKVPEGAPSKRYVLIGDGNHKSDDGDEIEIEDEQKPAYSGLNIYVQDNNLVITSDSDLTLPLYGVSGQLFRILQVKAGYNVYHGLHSGVYIALKKKFVIRR